MIFETEGSIYQRANDGIPEAANSTIPTTKPFRAVAYIYRMPPDRSEDHHGNYYHKHFSIPFAPSIGMTLNHGDYAFPIRGVGYNVETGEISIQLKEVPLFISHEELVEMGFEQSYPQR